MANENHPHPHVGRRGRRILNAEEDAAKLQFGEFADGEALTPGEVQAILAMSRHQPGLPPPPDSKVYKLTLDHVSAFANVDTDVAEHMRGALVARPGFLNGFEIAQIMYLRPERVDVAVALIPSLERYSHGDDNEDVLQQLLDDVRAMARYGTGP